MSEPIPEIATILRAIADRLQAGEANLAQNVSDAETLRQIAASCAGEGAFELRLHRKRGGQRRLVNGLAERLKRAERVKKYMNENGCGIPDAAEALAFEDHADGKGGETLRKAAQELLPILELPPEKRELMLYMKRQEALGRVSIRRSKGAKKRNSPGI